MDEPGGKDSGGEVRRNCGEEGEGVMKGVIRSDSLSDPSERVRWRSKSGGWRE